MGFTESLPTIDRVVWFLAALFFVLEKVVGFLKNLDWVWSRWGPKPDMTEDELKKEIATFSNEITTFLLERDRLSPFWRPLMARDDTEEERVRVWHENARDLSMHTKETVGLFRSKYLPRLAIIREEFKRRNLLHKEFDRYYKHINNTMVIQPLLELLAEMSVKI